MSWNPETRRYESSVKDMKGLNTPPRARLPKGTVHVAQTKAPDTVFDKVAGQKGRDGFDSLTRSLEDIEAQEAAGIFRHERLKNAGFRERLKMSIGGRIEELRPAAQGLKPNGRPKFQSPGLKERLRQGSLEQRAEAEVEEAKKPVNDLDRLQEA